MGRPRALGKRTSSIHVHLAQTGGICPRPRRRSRLALTLADREEISRGIARGESIRSIAEGLGRSPSTVSREIERNGGSARYRATLADERAWEKARRPKRCKLAGNGRLRVAVGRRLQMEWSPQQIAGWLKKEYSGDEGLQVSHETIYKSLFIQGRGALKKELQQHLRTKRTIRRSRSARSKGDNRGQIPDMVPIRERPAAVEDRAVPGHWEGDLIAGSRNTYIATLVERHTRYVMLAKVPSRDTETVINALIKQAGKLVIGQSWLRAQAGRRKGILLAAMHHTLPVDITLAPLRDAGV